MMSSVERNKISYFGRKAKQYQTLLSNCHIKKILPCGNDYPEDSYVFGFVFVDEHGNYFVVRKNDDYKWQCKPCKLTKPIEKVCASMFKLNTFWIDSGRDLYAFGENVHGLLGLGQDYTVYEPQKVSDMQRVLSVASGLYHSICLCAPEMTPQRLMFIFAYWMRMHCNEDVEMPSELVSVIGAYNKDLCDNRVFSAGWNTHGQAGYAASDNSYGAAVTQFTPIHHLHQLHINIVRVACGASHSLFLSETGDVYVCGINLTGQMGLGHNDTDRKMLPTRIPYFVNQKIRIINIQCGFGHSLCLDDKGVVYGFGENHSGQCGVDPNTTTKVTVPTPIALQAPTPMANIKCGWSHSYCRSVHGEHYLFGNNKYGQCLKKRKNVVFKALKINSNISSIKNVFLGNDLTFVTN